jgi:hypothetical protein
VHWHLERIQDGKQLKLPPIPNGKAEPFLVSRREQYVLLGEPVNDGFRVIYLCDREKNSVMRVLDGGQDSKKLDNLLTRTGRRNTVLAKGILTALSAGGAGEADVRLELAERQRVGRVAHETRVCLSPAVSA